jgi:hypothetical protein
MRNVKSTILVITVAAIIGAFMGAAALAVTALPAMADVFPSKPGHHVGHGPPFTSGNVGNGGGGALVVHIGNEACVTHFKDFQPTNRQTGGCD